MEIGEIVNFAKTFDQRSLQENLDLAMKVEDLYKRRGLMRGMMLSFLFKGEEFVMDFLDDLSPEEVDEIYAIRAICERSQAPLDTAVFILTNERRYKIFFGTAVAICRYIFAEFKDFYHSTMN